MAKAAAGVMTTCVSTVLISRRCSNAKKLATKHSSEWNGRPPARLSPLPSIPTQKYGSFYKILRFTLRTRRRRRAPTTVERIFAREAALRIAWGLSTTVLGHLPWVSGYRDGRDDVGMMYEEVRMAMHWSWTRCLWFPESACFDGRTWISPSWRVTQFFASFVSS